MLSNTGPHNPAGGSGRAAVQALTPGPSAPGLQHGSGDQDLVPHHPELQHQQLQGAGTMRREERVDPRLHDATPSPMHAVAAHPPDEVREWLRVHQPDILAQLRTPEPERGPDSGGANSLPGYSPYVGPHVFA